MTALQVTGICGLLVAAYGANIHQDNALSSTGPLPGKLVEESNATQVEVSEPTDLFQLVLRVRWLWPAIARWKFRAPQSASLKLTGAKPSASRPPREVQPDPTFTATDKYRLIKETDERCYWCLREIGSQLAIHGVMTTLRLEWDHVVPEHAGGATDISNMVPACHCCNRWKSGRQFETEAAIRTFLEERWTKELAVVIADTPFPTASIAEAVPENIAPVAVRPPRGKSPTPREVSLVVEAETPSDRPSRQWKYGNEVVIVSGSAHGRTGTVQGASHTKEGWVRVLLHPQFIPWRFLPEQLSDA